MGLRPGLYTEEMIREVFPVGMLQCNCLVFGDETTREAVVIDRAMAPSTMAQIQAYPQSHN